MNCNQSICWLDYFYKISTVIIAAINLFFVVFFFFIKDRKDASNKEKENKIQWFRAIVIDYKLKYYWEFFESITHIVETLKSPNLTDKEKGFINSNIADNFSLLRSNFIDLILALDKNLYDTILLRVDSFQDHLTNSIFDHGINLAHPPKYHELITKELGIVQTDIMKLIIQYKG